MTKYFSTEMLPELAGEDIQDYPLPFAPDIMVRIKSVPMARMRQYHDSVHKGGSVAAAADKALIRESVINEDGTPVYKTDAMAEQMLKGRTRLVTALIRLISLHNGGEDKLITETEAAEKKSETTP